MISRISNIGLFNEVEFRREATCRRTKCFEHITPFRHQGDGNKVRLKRGFGF